MKLNLRCFIMQIHVFYVCILAIFLTHLLTSTVSHGSWVSFYLILEFLFKQFPYQYSDWKIGKSSWKCDLRHQNPKARWANMLMRKIIHHHWLKANQIKLFHSFYFGGKSIENWCNGNEKNTFLLNFFYFFFLFLETCFCQNINITLLSITTTYNTKRNSLRLFAALFVLCHQWEEEMLTKSQIKI